MSALRSVIEELLSTDVSSLSDAELTDEAVETSRAIDLLTHRLGALAREVGARGTHESLGYLSVTRWLAVTADMDNSSARRVLGLGRFLHDNPETGRQASTGDLSHSRIRILGRAARRHPDQYRDDETMLLEFAHDMEMREFKKAVEYWMNCADDLLGRKDSDEQREASYLHASQTLGGMLRLDGLVDKEIGETILTAFDAAMAREARETGSGDDQRPASQRRADAMHEICRQFLDHFPGEIGGQRPHVSLILDLETLEGRIGRRCELDHTGTIPPEMARRLLCDADLSWVIVDSEQVPLSMGRARRRPTAAQMRALAIRDGGCTWKGCDRPPSWCDAHHIIAWSAGGPTDLDNLTLLCRRHHVMAHRERPGPYPDARPDFEPTLVPVGRERRGSGPRHRAPPV